MDMTKALKRHKQVGEHTGGGRRAGAYGSCIFNFFRNICNLSIVAVPVYIPTNSICPQCPRDIDKDCIESVDCFR